MSPDFRDLLPEFNAHRVQYLDAYALAAPGRVRATGDLDVRVRPETANARRVIGALEGFRAPVGDLTQADLARPGTVFQIGVAPLRIDVLTATDGVGFEEAWHGRVKARFADQDVAVRSVGHLVRNKRAAGRTQDLADLEGREKAAKP